MFDIENKPFIFKFAIKNLFNNYLPKKKSEKPFTILNYKIDFQFAIHC